MKRKLSYVILICLSLLLFSSIVYAAFVMTHNYEANIGYHEITITEGTGENATSVLSNTVTNNDLTFAEPGDVVEINYSLKNVDTKNYQHYYTLSTSSTDSKLLNMIYVYQNNEYCGVLSECLKNGLLGPEYILAGETGRTSTIKFELHNGASTYVTGTVIIPVTVRCNISTVDAQKVLFADDDASNFTKIIDDINSEAGKTVVLTSALTTSAEYTISNNCTIDLCGQTLTLGANITIAPGVEVKIINSRSAGSVAGSGKFVLNSADSFIELEATLPQANLQATTYNKTRLQEELAERFVNNNIIICGQAFDLLGNYVAYNPTVTITNGLTVTNGVVEAATTELATNQVVDVTIGGTLYEFKYIGNDDEVFASIIADDLQHLSQYIEGNLTRVSTNIFLPNIIKEHNATISWFSSNEMVLSNDGIIQFQDGSVELVATIKLYDRVFTHTYYINVVQEDNLSKLQLLATQVELGATIGGNQVSVLIKEVGDGGQQPLPLAGAVNAEKNAYYTNWVNGKNLGITKLEYEIESTYSYLSLNQLESDGILTSCYVYLNQMTFAKTARVKMIGTFDNGEVHEVYVNVKIELAASKAFEDKVYNEIQTYLDSVSVLENMLATRELSGVLNEKGDFEVPSMIQDVKITYELPNDARLKAMYEIQSVTNSDGTITQKVVFIDYTQFGLTDEKIGIVVKINVGTQTVVNPRTLTFTIPGAVTTTNFPTINLSDNNHKRIFYSFKYQTLQQSDSPYYSKSDSETIELIDFKTTDLSNLYSLPAYILMYDIENTEKLIFEYNSKEIIIDQYDIQTFKEIIAWATGTATTTVSNNSFNNFIDGYDWVASDGTTTLSDAEIKVILNYGERFQGFNERFSDEIYVGDNVLDDSDVGQLLEILSTDKVFVSIIKWIMNSGGDSIEIYDWLINDSSINLSNLFNELIKGELAADIEKTWTQEDTLFNYYVELTGSSEFEMIAKNYIYDNLTDEEKEGKTDVEIASLVAQKYNNLSDEQKRVITDYRFNALSNEQKNELINKYKEQKMNADFELLNETQIKNYYQKYLIENYNLHTDLLDYTNDATNNVTNNEESVIIYYTLSKYGNSSEKNEKTKYSKFYEAWNEVIVREKTSYDTVVKITSTSVPVYDPNNRKPNDEVTLDNCFDPVFTAIMHWATNMLDKSWSTGNSGSAQSLGDFLSNNYSSLMFDYTNLLDSSAVNYWHYSTSWGRKYRGHAISDDEWGIINTYLSYYGITSVFENNSDGTITEYKFTNVDLNVEDGYFVEFITNDETYPILTKKFSNKLIEAVNQKYNDSIFNEIVDWVISDTVELKCYDSNLYSELGISTHRVKDGHSSVSYNEYYVINAYFDYMSKSWISTFANAMKKHYIRTNISFKQGKNIIEKNSTGYKNILMAIDSSVEFQTIIEEITKLTQYEVPQTDYDGLDTISEEELERLVAAYGHNEQFITVLKGLISTYKITGTVNNYTVDINDSITIDRTFGDKTDDEIKILLYGTKDVESFKYLSIDKIDTSDTEIFKILKYYVNLNDLTFRGEKNNFLFASSNDANQVLQIVSDNASSLSKLVMSYCGLSNISPITSLTKLTELDLRGNFSCEQSVKTTTSEGETEEKYIYEGIKNINPLIELVNNQKGTGVTLQYLNVFNTDVDSATAEVALGKIYKANNDAKLWYDYAGYETLYVPKSNTENYFTSIEVISLLYEITSMTGKYIILPESIYTATNTSYTITWKVEEANGLVRYDDVYNRIIKLDNATTGTIIISASVTVGTGDAKQTAIRYFFINVS